MKFHALINRNGEKRNTFSITNSQRSARILTLWVTVFPRVWDLKTLGVQKVATNRAWLNRPITYLIKFTLFFANSIVAVFIITIIVRIAWISWKSIWSFSTCLYTWFLSSFGYAWSALFDSVIHWGKVAFFGAFWAFFSVESRIVVILGAKSGFYLCLGITLESLAWLCERDS